MRRLSPPRPDDLATPYPPAAALRAARVAAGLSQRELANRLGYVSTADISRFETGCARPWPAFRRRVAAVLGLPEVDVFPEVLA